MSTSEKISILILAIIGQKCGKSYPQEMSILANYVRVQENITNMYEIEKKFIFIDYNINKINFIKLFTMTINKINHYYDKIQTIILIIKSFEENLSSINN